MGGSGTIEYEEFLKMMTHKILNRDPKDEILKAFRLFDDDETGKISFKNLKRVAKELGENMTDEELQEMIDEADRDGDGEINEGVPPDHEKDFVVLACWHRASVKVAFRHGVQAGLDVLSSLVFQTNAARAGERRESLRLRVDDPILRRIIALRVVLCLCVYCTLIAPPHL